MIERDETRLTISDRTGWRAYLLALGAVAAALTVAELLYPLAGVENVDLVFLAFIVAVAARHGFGPALVASLSGVLVYNFFFIPPIHTFEVDDPKGLAALAFFLASALITSQVAAWVRAQAFAARRQTRRIEDLYSFSRRIGGADPDLLAETATHQIATLVNRDAFLLLPDQDGVLQVASGSNRNAEGDMDLYTARTFWEGGTWVDRKVMRIGDHFFYPVRSKENLAGLVALSQESAAQLPTEEEDTIFEVVCNQLGVALERARLREERDAAKRIAESERLRTSLLNSLSHDLRTPLASITGGVTALRQFSSLYDASSRDELLATIQEEAERMTSFVTNLLDMSRIEAGGVMLNREPADLNEIVGSALRRMENALAKHDVLTDLAPDLPLISVDVVLAEQVVVNLLDNAEKYAPEGSTIAIETRWSGDAFTLTVRDQGPGIPPAELEDVFGKFYRARHGDRRPAGTGLGLAICRGFVEAMGGKIWAGNQGDGGGAVLTVSLPEALAASANAGTIA